MFKNLSLFILLINFNLNAQVAPQVKVNEGILEGTQLKSGIISFKGIPFAAPPVGELRWKAPQPAKKWSGIRKAVAFSDNAMQKAVYGDMQFRSSGMSEDCLYLNIWTPTKKNSEKLPVLVYFYGGGFVAGDGSESRYDGESLAEKGIVTVTLNYRLGIFGFMAHPELTKESSNNASGNYGLLDQAAALKWVKQNIAAFGGDPEKITIAGESAGSISVSAQMVSPLSKNLISGAIGQSGAMIKPTLDALPLAESEKIGIAFAQKVNAKSLAELRAMNALQLLEEASKPDAFKTRATIEGYFLKSGVSEAFKGGYQAQVPLLVGWTSVELPYMTFMQGQYPSPENYKKRVLDTYKDWASEILKKYPGNNEKEVIESATALGSDAFIVYSTWKWAELHKQNTKKPIYVYKFSRQRPPLKTQLGVLKEGLAGGLSKVENEKSENIMPEGVIGANHASDIEYALGNLSGNTFYEWTPDDFNVSATMEDFFANFIKTGNPNGKNLPDWSRIEYDNALNIMTIDIQSSASPEENRERYLLLDQYFTSQ